MEKYPGILSYGIVLVTLGIKAFSQENKTNPKKWRDMVGEIIITILIISLTMFVFAPHLFLKLNLVRDALTIEARSTHVGADNLNWLGNLLFYLQVFVKASGWIVVLLGIVGLGFSIFLKQPSMLLLYFGAGYWVAISRLGLHWERWSLPMMITPLMLAAMGVTKVWAAVKPQRVVKVIVMVFLGVFAAFYSFNGLSVSILLTWRDTRVAALQFVEANNITQQNSVFEGYTPFLPRTVQSIFDFDINNPSQIDYVILSSNMFGRYEAEPERYTTETAFYTDLRVKVSLIAEFTASNEPDNPIEQLTILGDYLSNLLKGTKTTYITGPTIQIYQLP